MGTLSLLPLFHLSFCIQNIWDNLLRSIYDGKVGAAVDLGNSMDRITETNQPQCNTQSFLFVCCSCPFFHTKGPQIIVPFCVFSRQQTNEQTNERMNERTNKQTKNSFVLDGQGKREIGAL